MLLSANWRITDEGSLEGSMTDDDASRARSLMQDCRIARVDTGHGSAATPSQQEKGTSEQQESGRADKQRQVRSGVRKFAVHPPVRIGSV